MHEDPAHIKRIRDGDIEAFEVIVDKYRNKLFSFLVKMTCSRQDSGRNSSGGFYPCLPTTSTKYDDRWSFSTWIYRITVNTYKSHMKKTRRHKKSAD